ncbi:MAG: DUF1464 family protein [Candidatus Latescibacteria bacterium]|nr:DUF1464 family protein [Candidatus Latescibacterota bacterium]
MKSVVTKKIIGIDPGTKSFDILGIEFTKDKEKIFLDKSIPSEQVAMNPEILLSEIKPYLPVDAIIGPSGYGLPITKLDEAGEAELSQMLPIEGGQTGGVSVNEGIKRLFRKMKEMGLPVYFTPGVIHLPTVPEYRKLNHMDMGTADKLCCVVLAIKDQMQRLKIKANQTSFVLLEMGYGFTSCIAVKDGQVIDGLGGTLGFPGFLGTGHIDGELAIRMGKSPQGILFTGGASSIAKKPIKNISELLKYKQVFSLLTESAIKDIACMLVSHSKPKEIILSGRLCREQVIYYELKKQIKKQFPKTIISRVKRTAKIAKEATEGAVILGAGILGVKYTDIYNSLKVEKAKGTMYDYINIANIKNQISK